MTVVATDECNIFFYVIYVVNIIKFMLDNRLILLLQSRPSADFNVKPKLWTAADDVFCIHAPL